MGKTTMASVCIIQGNKLDLGGGSEARERETDWGVSQTVKVTGLGYWPEN